jgi:hypothetical protein
MLMETSTASPQTPHRKVDDACTQACVVERPPIVDADVGNAFHPSAISHRTYGAVYRLEILATPGRIQSAEFQAA